MIVGDNQFGSLNIFQHVVWHQLPCEIIVFRVIGLQDAQAITNREARSHDQEAAGELLASGSPNRIDRLPRNKHGHHGGFASTRGEFERQSIQ